MTVCYIMHTELMSLLLQKNSLHKIACNILPETILTLLNICYIIYSITLFFFIFVLVINALKYPFINISEQTLQTEKMFDPLCYSQS